MSSNPSIRPRFRPVPYGLAFVELLVVLAIVAIVMGLALPSFGNLFRSAARTSTVNDFMHAIFLARSQAIMLNGVVSICRSTDGETCDDKAMGWDRGWIVFHNLDRDQPANRDDGEPLVHRHAGSEVMSITSNRLSFSFRPTNQADVNGTIIFCDPRGTNADGRAIVISHTGRPRVSKRDGSNKPLSCV
ncbi:MAG TPA: GspH/FimT family pseudopilin [Steroidobacteraceae bacterium]|nr:GspH/FimT family pseudopilin [Steroidobacteraceae bacterium]